MFTVLSSNKIDESSVWSLLVAKRIKVAGGRGEVRLKRQCSMSDMEGEQEGAVFEETRTGLERREFLK
eukprot:scaffold6319_cov29-Attheya_sp.AAC.2